MSELTHFSLCSGIGGIDLAAKWAGFKTIAHCEIDDYASKVLAKNFKGVHNFGDIRAITNESLANCDIAPSQTTVLSAGFPCQPYSLAGKGRGNGDERDLWAEVARVISLVKPTWFVGENTPGLFARVSQRYFIRILADLARLGYTVAWGIWGASDVGAWHKRDRIFIVAHKNSVAPHTISERRRGLDTLKKARCADVFIPLLSQKERTQEYPPALLSFYLERSFTSPMCNILRNDDGLSVSMDRIRSLGNAVVPQQAYPIFKAIADIEGAKIYE